MKVSIVVNRIASAYVLCDYLRELATQVGEASYRRNFVRREHGPGTGFFGISNSGSADCAAAAFRAVTDALDQRNNAWQGIEFISESCLHEQAPKFVRGNGDGHRVEHTIGVSTLFKEFEDEFIVPGKSFSALDLARFVVPRQIVCLIRAREQVSTGEINRKVPFSRYSSRIFFRGEDVSNHSLDQLLVINMARYRGLLDSIQGADFSVAIQRSRIKLLGSRDKHCLPPMPLAVQYGESEFELLYKHYGHKLRKRIDARDRSWYSAEDAARYSAWLAARPAEDGVN